MIEYQICKTVKVYVLESKIQESEVLKVMSIKAWNNKL